MKRLITFVLALALGASLMTAAATARSSAAAAPATPRADSDIVQTAVAAGQFKTPAKLPKRAGPVSALRQPGPYTVFAPTNAAFKQVPKKTLNNGVIHVVNRVLIPPAR
jgi:uncharacterized surface protein with fasciclin (FAS1) repeats